MNASLHIFCQFLPPLWIASSSLIPTFLSGTFLIHKFIRVCYMLERSLILDCISWGLLASGGNKVFQITMNLICFFIDYWDNLSHDSLGKIILRINKIKHTDKWYVYKNSCSYYIKFRIYSMKIFSLEFIIPIH